jgi:transcriptional regulator with XRE-family HTH domain
MSMNSTREQLVRKLQDKEYRDAFVCEQIFSRLPLKIRSIREHRQLSQKQLGEKAGVAQAWVSKLEDPNYGKLTISTLIRLASAFDVGLEIDFVPFAKVLDDALKLSPESFEVPSFAEDKGLLPRQHAPERVRRRRVVSNFTGKRKARSGVA